jgi:hypothetical protein
METRRRQAWFKGVACKEDDTEEEEEEEEEDYS